MVLKTGFCSNKTMGFTKGLTGGKKFIFLNAALKPTATEGLH
jgi:hypothetical protein